MRHKRIIIWGYKPHTGHTHLYIHQEYYKAAKSMGYETYWLDHTDSFDPSLFDDALVITEHYAPLRISPNMPMSKTSTYFIHYMGNRPDNPENPDGAGLYRDKVGRFLDFRYNGYGWNDKNYNYVHDKNKSIKISDGSRFEKGPDGYDYFYSMWATDLLPNEIDLTDAYKPREPISFFAGTIRDDNSYLFDPLIKALDENGIKFVWNNTYQQPLTTAQVREMISKSKIAVDVRGEVWQKGGYMPCRVFKNISYGQLGVTNSIAVNEMFGDMVAFDLDPYQMVYKAMPRLTDFKKIQESMVYVRDNHTYVNRIKDIVEVATNYE